jgi:hypothetical protein
LSFENLWQVKEGEIRWEEGKPTGGLLLFRNKEGLLISRGSENKGK